MAAETASPLDIDSLFHTYYADVVRLAVSILEDQDEAEDAAQDSFIAAARAFESFQGLSSVRTWLFSIAINVCRDALRRRKAKRWLRIPLALFQRPDEAADAALQRQVELNERDQDLWRAVNRLDEKHRIPVILHYVHSLSAPEISQVLGIGENTVHSRLYYARRQLEGELNRHGLTKEAIRE